MYIDEVYQLTLITRKTTSVYLNISPCAYMNRISCILSDVQLRTQQWVMPFAPLAWNLHISKIEK
jgi:hypothetical protein